MIKPIKSQIEVAEKIIQAFDNGASDVFLEAPTGSGKSGIAYFCHQLSKWTLLLLSHQKVLQDQYENLLDESTGRITLKGKSNYFCAAQPGLTTDKAPCSVLGLKKCGFRGHCEYFVTRSKAVKAPIVNTNYQQFFSLIDAGALDFIKNLTVFDECHMIPTIYTDFKKYGISTKDIAGYKFASKCLDFLGKKYHANICDDIADYVKSIDFDNLNEEEALKISNDIHTIEEGVVSRLFSHLNGGLVEDEWKKLDKKGWAQRFSFFQMMKVKSYNNFSVLMDNKELFFDNDNFAIETKEIGETKEFEIIPLTIAPLFSKEVGFNTEKRLFMSSTIFGVERFRNELGLTGKYEKIVLQSKFPVENRQVFVMPIVKLNNTILYDTKNKQLTEYFDLIHKICKEHIAENHSGVIFTSSYKMSSLLINNLKKKLENEGAEILNNKDSEERNLVIERFRDKSENHSKILISPSFFEGVNFEEDISRFQIIGKVPFKSLGSEFVKKKMRKDPIWYSLDAIKQIVQAAGRSIRNETDFALTYILDSNWVRISTQCKIFIPQWFKDAIVIFDGS